MSAIAAIETGLALRLGPSRMTDLHETLRLIVADPTPRGGHESGRPGEAGRAGRL